VQRQTVATNTNIKHFCCAVDFPMKKQILILLLATFLKGKNTRKQSAVVRYTRTEVEIMLKINHVESICCCHGFHYARVETAISVSVENFDTGTPISTIERQRSHQLIVRNSFVQEYERVFSFILGM